MRSGRSIECRFHRPGEVERRRQHEDVLAVHLELAHQQLEHVLRHRLLDLEPHGRAEPAPLQLLLERLQQVVRAVVDLEVGVARDPERVVLDDLHAREELVEVGGDHLLEGHEAAALARTGRSAAAAAAP